MEELINKLNGFKRSLIQIILNEEIDDSTKIRNIKLYLRDNMNQIVVNPIFEDAGDIAGNLQQIGNAFDNLDIFFACSDVFKTVINILKSDIPDDDKIREISSLIM